MLNFIEEFDKEGGNQLSLKPKGADFRLLVWDILCHILYGQVMTYGDIAIASELTDNVRSDSWTQSYPDYHSLSSGSRNKWQFNRICRRG